MGRKTIEMIATRLDLAHSCRITRRVAFFLFEVTMDLIKYARLVCYGSCKEYVEPIGKPKECFLTKEQYDDQMRLPDKGWKCLSCGEYPCDFDDAYWENNVGIS